MATTVARLEAVLTAQTRDFDRSMDKSEGKMSGLAKTAGKAGLAGAIIGLGYAAKVGFSEFMEAQRITAQTNAVLKSTGGVANVSAKEIDALANSTLRKTGIDDEQIKTGENMLLTFTRIRNEVGKGNDIFTQATKATTDLSVAMGKDMQSSAILVGKALNDPIKGLTALRRVGVAFTEQQQDQIKALVKSGDTMQAQKIILGELNTEFGGSAVAAGKTFSGQINIARETLRNLAADGVAFLIPYLQQFTGWIINTAIPFLRNFSSALQGNEGAKGAFQVVTAYVRDFFIPVIKGIVGVFRDAFEAVGRVLNNHREQVETIVGAVKTILRGIGLVMTEVVIPTLQFVFKKGGPFDVAFGLAIDIIAGVIKVIERIASVTETVIGATTKAVNKAAPAFKAAWELLLAPINLVVHAIHQIVEDIQWIGDKGSDIIGKVAGALGKVGGVIGHIPGIGDATDPGMTLPGGRGSLMGALPIMQPFANAAAAFGLLTTSGLRPGAITKHGTLSDHAVGKALDESGSPTSMAAFFMSLIGNPRVKQAFYDPLGSIFGGVLSSYREGGHSDHVHVATYDKGGLLMPGWTAAFNGTGRPERVGGGDIVIPVSIGGEHIATVVFNQVRQKAKVYEKRNGKPAF